MSYTEITPSENAGDLQKRICAAMAERAPGFLRDYDCYAIAGEADVLLACKDDRLANANAEIARLTRELEFARAANRKHVRDLTDARNENDRLRSGGLAIAL